ncbi:MAG: hypothetical protein C5B51_27480 [Terriglobia bacterium]|nr:MAG: hypothetical protein C5B51_27480 [Terriglobia bacterium]
MGGFVPPAAGQSYTDANFGSNVTPLTPPGYVHGPSPANPFSAHGKYLWIRSVQSRGLQVVNAVTGQALGSGPASPDLLAWDAYNDDIYYYANGARIVKHTLSTAQDATIADYSADAHHFSTITAGAGSDTSKDNWIAFWAPKEHQVCALNLTVLQTLCANYLEPQVVKRAGWDSISSVLIARGVDSASGKRYVLLMGSPAMGMWSVNRITGQLDFEMRGPENPELAGTSGNGDNICNAGESCLGEPPADVLEDTDGKQYLVTMKAYTAPCALQLVTLALSAGQQMYLPAEQGGGRTAVLPVAQCGEIWPDYSVGCARQAPYCAVSTNQGAFRDRSDVTTPFPAAPHRDEVMVMRGNGQEVRRLAMSRSVLFTDDNVWPRPRAAISPDASYVVFDSNFGVLAQERVNLVTTGFGESRPATQLAVSPGTVTLGPSQTQQFTLVGTHNSVTWSINPPTGNITPDGGLYTAPATIAAQQVVTVTAKVVATGKTATAGVTLQPPPPPASAAFVTTDATTRGSWKGVYGTDGYNVINDSASYPAYVTPTPSGNLSYTWAASTSDSRGLQKVTVANDRIAACWYTTSAMSLDLNFTDGKSHQVDLYLVDWDTYGPRTERVDILDTNGTVLDSRAASNFTGGVYLVWTVSGHVVVRVTNTNGASNAVVSGIFFGSAGQPPIGVSVSPTSAMLGPSQTQQFTATVTNGPPGVTWSLNPALGSISPDGLYTAPAAINAAQTVTVTATSTADTSKSATASINLQPPIVVTVAPPSMTLTASQTQQFTAIVANGPSGVTWSLNPAVGTISPSGLYTAPVTVNAAQTVTVTATSTADTSKSGNAVVTLQPVQGGINNLTVIGATPTQAIVSYTAPNASACVLEVSESNTYNPLVNDVNPGLFAGANLDNRPGNLVNGVTRIAIIGKRAADVALNQRQYSRSLQNNTPHYLRVTCGSSVATATFTTANLPYGNTYPDASTSMLASPGSYNWPTIDANTGRTTDPQTGVAMWPFGFGSGWTSGARTIMCSQFPVADNSAPAKYGYPCMPVGGSDLYWLDTTDGIVRDIGKPLFVYCGSGCYNGDTVDPQPITSYSQTLTADGHFLAATYTDPQNTLIMMSGSYNGHWQAGDIGTLSWTNLTPAAQGQDVLTLMHGFDSSFNPAMVAYAIQIGLTGDQTKAILYAEYGIQNSIGYVAIFDPAARGASPACAPGGCIVAMLGGFKSSQTRWAGFHSENAVEGSAAWMTFEPSNTVYANGYWPMDSGGRYNGDGPYIVTTTTALTAVPKYAAGMTIPGFTGVTCPAGAVGCDVMTVSGPPCDPTPGANEPGNCPWNSGYYYMMDAAVGDWFMPQDNSCGVTCEQLQIIGINGNSWAVRRAGWQWPQDHSSITVYGMISATNHNSAVSGWNFAADPMGTGSGVVVDAVAAFDHGTYSNTAAGGGDAISCPPQIPATACVVIKTGTSPAAMLDQPATVTINTAPSYSGVTGISPTTVVETYTSGPPIRPLVSNPNFVVQTKPIEGGPVNTYTPVTGNLYKVTINSGFGSYDPKTSVAAAACNGKPMLNISSAVTGNVINTDNTASYEYCYAKNANECRSGSNPGEFYVNCPGYNANMSQNYVIASTSLVAKYSQLRWDDPNTAGRDTRPLTSGFRPFVQFTPYVSGRAVPSGDAVLVYSDQVPSGGQSAISMVRVPPTVAWDGVDRTTWVPVSVSAIGKTGTTAVVKFGYAENGAPSSFYCASRQEACVANKSNIGSPAYYFAGENPIGQACSSGCSFQIPGISGRVVYYQVTYNDGTTDPLQAAYVP